MNFPQGKTEVLRSKNSRAVLLLAAAGAMAAMAVVGMSDRSRSGAKTITPSLSRIPVSVVKVRQSNVPLTETWVGTLDGFVDAQIQPQVSGYLIRQNYREGSTVAKDQLLFQIDPRPFQAAVDQAEAQVAQAKGQLAQALAQQGLAQIQNASSHAGGAVFVMVRVVICFSSYVRVVI